MLNPSTGSGPRAGSFRNGRTNFLTPRVSQKIAKTLVWAAGAVTVLIMLLIIGYVLVNGISYLTPSFLTTAPKGGLSGEGGISTVIVSTLWLLGMTMIILIPLGIGASIYLEEYAPKNKLTEFIHSTINILAGVPSIIFGLFGFALFVTILHFRFSILSGSLTLVCLLLPTLVSTSEEALKAVPRSHREAALALGATKWQSIWHVVLPTAIPGIITGVILCTGRAIGETACLYVTMGGSAGMPRSIFSGGRTLALHIYYLATDTNAMNKAMTTAAVLIIIIIIINTITNIIAQRFHTKIHGA
ncbi:MAG: phosphate ABC transporter permease PstA [Chloroflexi bacterium]|nr:phosphate ABC transporter permease PstA [Chloroflexota bacterium]